MHTHQIFLLTDRRRRCILRQKGVALTQYRIPDTPLVEGDRAKLTTTLNRLKAANACAERYRHLVQALGGVSFDHDAPINLLTILDLNGVDDCLWALHTTAEDCERQTRLIIADCAESVLYLFERERPDDNRPRVAIEMARRLARGEVDSAASDAARDAAWAAVTPPVTPPGSPPGTQPVTQPGTQPGPQPVTPPGSPPVTPPGPPPGSPPVTPPGSPPGPPPVTPPGTQPVTPPGSPPVTPPGPLRGVLSAAI